MTRVHILIRFVGNLLKGQTVGVIGAGRIGSAYARMMVILRGTLEHGSVTQVREWYTKKTCY